MKNHEILDYCLQELTANGVEKSSCYLQLSKKQELNIHTGKISLFRTTFDKDLHITAIINNQKGSIVINKLGIQQIDNAVEKVIDLAKSSQPDPANDISPRMENKKFSKGYWDADLDLMYKKMSDFNQTVSEQFPRIILEEVILDHTSTEIIFLNTNGVDLQAEESSYTFVPMFTAKENKQISSFNYTVYSDLDLRKDLIDVCTINTILKQTSEQISTKKIRGKFKGDLIITPDCLAEFVSYITAYLHDYSLISGTSIYKNKLNQKIISGSLTLHSRPVADDISQGYFITSDGFEAKNATIIDKGVLRSFLLSQYGSNKTGLPRGINQGGCYSIESGTKSLEDMIKSVEKGILLCRFSGGNPNDMGDFSGIAKNSYYIENGRIMYPISETMISGNLELMFNNTKSISSESVNFGWQKMPWIQFGEIDISSK